MISRDLVDQKMLKKTIVTFLQHTVHNRNYVRDVHTYVYLPWMSLEEDEVSPVKGNMIINNIYIRYIHNIIGMYICTCQGFIWDLMLVGGGGMVHMESLSVMSHSIIQ